MKKFAFFLVGWVILSGVFILLPKLLEHFQPRIVYKELWRVRNVEVVKEVPVFQDERIVEKEKVVYTPSTTEYLRIQTISDDEFTVELARSDWASAQISFEADRFIHFKRKARNVPMHFQAFPR